MHAATGSPEYVCLLQRCGRALDNPRSQPKLHITCWREVGVMQLPAVGIKRKRRCSDVSQEQRTMIPVSGKRKGSISSCCCLCGFLCPTPAGPSAGSKMPKSKPMSSAAVGNDIWLYPSSSAAFARSAMSPPTTATVGAAPCAPLPLPRAPSAAPPTECSSPKQL